MKAAKITIESRLASVKEAEAPGTEKGQTVTIGRGGNVNHGTESGRIGGDEDV